MTRAIRWPSLLAISDFRFSPKSTRKSTIKVPFLRVVGVRHLNWALSRHPQLSELENFSTGANSTDTTSRIIIVVVATYVFVVVVAVPVPVKRF